MSKRKVHPEYDVPAPNHLLKELKALASQYIRSFFTDKVGKDGQPLNGVVEKVIQNEDYLSMVMNTDVEQGMDRIYSVLKCTPQQLEESRRQGKPAADVQTILRLTHQMATRGIPKNYSTGLIILYLHFCEGYQLLT